MPHRITEDISGTTYFNWSTASDNRLGVDLSSKVESRRPAFPDAHFWNVLLKSPLGVSDLLHVRTTP